MKLGILLIILVAGAGAGTANALCRVSLSASFIYGGERGKAAPVIFGAYDKDGAGWTVTKNVTRRSIRPTATIGFSVSNKTCVYPCRLTLRPEMASDDVVLILRRLTLTVSETFTEPQFAEDDDSFEINQCNEETATADGKCNLLYEIDYLALPTGAKPLPAIFGAYDKDGTGWTVPRNLSRDAGLGRDGFFVSDKRCMYPCRITFQRNKTKANEIFHLSSLRIAVRETFRVLGGIHILNDDLVEIKQCDNKTAS